MESCKGRHKSHLRRLERHQGARAPRARREKKAKPPASEKDRTMFVHTLGHFFPARLCLDGSLTPSAGSLPSPIGRRRISTAELSAGTSNP